MSPFIYLFIHLAVHLFISSFIHLTLLFYLIFYSNFVVQTFVVPPGYFEDSSTTEATGSDPEPTSEVSAAVSEEPVPVIVDEEMD